MEIAVFKWIKANPEVILFYQRQQLFRKSIGSDSEPLGFYSYSTEVFTKGRKKYKEPFTMVDSGSFREGLFVKTYYRHLIISSTTPNLDKMYDNEAYNTHNFFGLTEDSYNRFINNQVKPFLRTWLREQILEE